MPSANDSMELVVTGDYSC